jgi:hypothetical protein
MPWRSAFDGTLSAPQHRPTRSKPGCSDGPHHVSLHRLCSTLFGIASDGKEFASNGKEFASVPLSIYSASSTPGDSKSLCRIATVTPLFDTRRVSYPEVGTSADLLFFIRSPTSHPTVHAGNFSVLCSLPTEDTWEAAEAVRERPSRIVSIALSRIQSSRDTPRPAHSKILVAINPKKALDLPVRAGAGDAADRCWVRTGH